MGIQKGNMDTHGDMGLLGEHLDPIIVGRIKEDGYESRSGSDNNLEGASGDDQGAGEDQRCRKKKYNRHTPHQIQELEMYGFIYLFMVKGSAFVFSKR